MSSKLQLNQPAPDFTALSDDGKQITLSALRGKWVVLYFYPKANSYGCSIEAQKFEASLPEFERLNAQLIGISTDTVASQLAFRQKCHLSFPLLADPDQHICQKYDVMGGVTALMGVAGRASFVIDPEGQLVYELRNMLHTVHVPGALAELKKRQGEGE